MKNARIFLSIHALTTGILGVIFVFLPNFIGIEIGSEASQVASFILQLFGGLLMGLAMLSWMSRAQAIGGIYARPLVMTNFVFTLIGLLTCIKAPEVLLSLGPIGIALGLYFVLFGLAFSILLFKSPV